MASNDQLLISILEQLASATTSNGNKLDRIIDLLEKIDNHVRQTNTNLDAVCAIAGSLEIDMYNNVLDTQTLALQVKIVE